MSHVATVDVEVKDLDALQTACTRLGLEFVPDQKTYRWYGEHVGDYPLPPGFQISDLGMCDHAIKIPDYQASPVPEKKPYEIGVVARRDGRPGFQMMWDFFCGGFGLQERVGENCSLLKQAYATEVAKKAAIASGFRVNEVRGQNGAIRLVLNK